MNKVLEKILQEVDTLPEGDQERIVRVLETEVRKSKRTAPTHDRWVRFAQRMHREAPMTGQSEEFLKKAREFRDNFDLSMTPDDR